MKALVTSIFGFETKTPRWLLFVVICGVATLICWYVASALEHGIKKNVVSEYNDQRTYMRAGISLRDTNYTDVVSRMRMPLYMYAMSFIAAPHEDAEKLFPRAKIFNVFYSLVLLGALFFQARKWMGGWLALVFTLIATGQLFLFKAAYVQPELTLATVIVITAFWAVQTLHEPTWKNALVTGLLLCVWFFTKASAQIALGLFGALLGVKWLCAGKGRRLPYITAGLITLTAYLVPMSPYLWTSYKYFGEPFYNVQSKYYMWAEDVDEKHWLQSLNLDYSLHQLKPGEKERLPSAAKYWRNHTKQEILERLERGLEMMFREAYIGQVVIKDPVTKVTLTAGGYSWLFLFMLGWASIAFLLVTFRWDDAVKGFLRWKWETLYVCALLLAFTLLFGWFVPMKVGPRLVLSVSLVPVAFLIAVSHHLLKEQSVSISGTKLSLEKLLTAAMIAIWIGVTFTYVPFDLANYYFGG
jgi:hypothetical protein